MEKNNKEKESSANMDTSQPLHDVNTDEQAPSALRSSPISPPLGNSTSPVQHVLVQKAQNIQETPEIVGIVDIQKTTLDKESSPSPEDDFLKGVCEVFREDNDMAAVEETDEMQKHAAT